MQRLTTLTAAAVLTLTLLSCKKAAPAGVAATVNNRAVAYAELDKTFQSQFPQQPEGSSEDQVMSQKLELLGSLINNEIMLQRAEKLGLTAVDADVDTEFNKMKAPYTKEEFDRQLASRKMTVDDLKSQLRRDLTIQKLINKEITSHITITDGDVASFYNANKASFNLAEPQIHMAQIAVTSVPDPNVRNLKNSKAKNEAEARQKILEIETRLKKGGPESDFSMLAQNYSEDPQSAPNGGDMGFVPESALEKANPELRKMVASLQPGGVSPIIHTQEGYRILKVISKEPAGQRELNDPRVQQSIRETLLNRKDQLLKAAYYEVARNATRVENFLARSILENAGKTSK
jgi:peptidyl-prolyl cis-trans isomerase SurA